MVLRTSGFVWLVRVGAYSAGVAMGLPPPEKGESTSLRNLLLYRRSTPKGVVTREGGS